MKKTGAFHAIKLPRQKTHFIQTTRVGPKMKGADGAMTKGGHWTKVHVQRWEYPDVRCSCKSCQSEWEESASLFADEDHHLESQISSMFFNSYNDIMAKEHSINIIVRKGGYRATFLVPQNRWKYFFRERIKIKTRSGRTKPIYHAVVAHKRELKTGKTSYVKTHYRGLRHFFWKGHEIKIVMPGKHGLAQSHLDSSFYDESDRPRNKEMIKTGDMVNEVVAMTEGEWGLAKDLMHERKKRAAQ